MYRFSQMPVLAGMILLASVLASVSAIAQSSLHACTGKNSSSWSGCTGTLASGNTILYSGEFLNGKKHGYGEEIIP